MKSIAAETHSFVNNYIYGIDNMDADAINRAVANMNNITNYINLATEELEQVTSP